MSIEEFSHGLIGESSPWLIDELSQRLFTPGMETIDQVRHRKFLALIDEAGSVKRAAELLGVSSAQVSQLKNRSPHSTTGKARAIGDEFARKIEDSFGKPRGWLDASGEAINSGANEPFAEDPVRLVAAAPEDGYIRIEHLSATPTMGLGGVVDEPVHVVRHLDVLERWMREEVGSTDPGRIKVLTAVGRSMHPQIEHRDLVFVDVGHNWIDAPGIYVIDVAGRLLLKKALIQANGTLTLRSENQAEFPDEERYDLKRDADQITVCGKVMAWWTLRKG